jgi:hypothetical protein
MGHQRWLPKRPADSAPSFEYSLSRYQCSAEGVMTSIDFSTVAFALLNGARIVAYVPQIMCVRRDRHGAVGVSLMTWGLFTLANLATVSYALTVSGDIVVAGVFAFNSLGCFAIFTLTAVKRIPVSTNVQHDIRNVPVRKFHGLVIRLSHRSRRRLIWYHLQKGKL